MNSEKKSVTLTIGWVMLLIMGGLLLLGGLGSLLVAYIGGDSLGGVRLDELVNTYPGLPGEIRGRRATAASLAVISGVLIAWIAAAAYRRGEKWAWWALLCSVGTGAALSILRILALGTRLGAGGAAFFLVWLLLALAISYRDMK